ncbi:hypothetical protein WJ977_27690 [Achromobacter xylosoxidans]
MDAAMALPATQANSNAAVRLPMRVAFFIVFLLCDRCGARRLAVPDAGPQRGLARGSFCLNPR